MFVSVHRVFRAEWRLLILRFSFHIFNKRKNNRKKLICNNSYKQTADPLFIKKTSFNKSEAFVRRKLIVFLDSFHVIEVFTSLFNKGISLLYTGGLNQTIGTL